MVAVRSQGIVIIALALTTTTTVTGLLVSPTGYLSPIAWPNPAGPSRRDQGIARNVSIGPVNPTCYVGTGSIQPAAFALSFEQNRILITPRLSLAITVPVNWTLHWGCELTGTFQTSLSPGTYSVDLTSCALATVRSFGCSGLPMTVVVGSGKYTPVNISVSTGIE